MADAFQLARIEFADVVPFGNKLTAAPLSWFRS